MAKNGIIKFDTEKLEPSVDADGCDDNEQKKAH